MVAGQLQDALLRDAALASGALLFQPATVTAIARQADQHTLTLRRAERIDEVDGGWFR